MNANISPTPQKEQITPISIEETDNYVIIIKDIEGFKVRSFYPHNAPNSEKNLEAFFKELNKRNNER